MSTYFFYSVTDITIINFNKYINFISPFYYFTRDILKFVEFVVIVTMTILNNGYNISRVLCPRETSVRIQQVEFTDIADIESIFDIWVI